MAETIEQYLIEVGADISGALNGLNSLRGAVGNLASSIGNMAFDFLAGGVDQIKKEELATTQLNAALRSTGATVGMTTDQSKKYSQSLLTLADNLEKTTRYSRETTIGAESLLLTFTKVGKDAFPSVIETAQDMSTAMGLDLNQAILQIGKALNDPIKGAGNLRREGVMLTDQQQAQIKTMVQQNNLLGAQKIVLQELATEFGGSAAAAGTTFAGKMDIASAKLGDFARSLAETFMPALDAIVSGISWFGGILDSLDPSFKTVIAGVMLVAAALSPVGAAFLAAAAPIAGLIAIVGGVAIAFENNFGGIKDIVMGAYNAVKPALDDIGQAVGNFMGALGQDKTFTTTTRQVKVGRTGGAQDMSGDGAQFKSVTENMVSGTKDIGQRIVDAVGAALPNLIAAGEKLIEGLVGAIQKGFPKFIDGLGQLVSNGFNWLRDNFPGLLNAGIQLVEKLVSSIADAAPKLVTGLGNLITNGLTALKDNLPHLVTGGLEFVQHLVGDIAGHAGTLAIGLGTLLGEAIGRFIAALPGIIQGGADIISSLVTDLIKHAPDLVQGFLDLVTKALPDALSKLAAAILSFAAGIIQGIIDAIKGGSNKAAIADAIANTVMPTAPGDNLDAKNAWLAAHNLPPITSGTIPSGGGSTSKGGKQSTIKFGMDFGGGKGGGEEGMSSGIDAATTAIQTNNAALTTWQANWKTAIATITELITSTFGTGGPLYQAETDVETVFTKMTAQFPKIGSAFTAAFSKITDEITKPFRDAVMQIGKILMAIASASPFFAGLGAAGAALIAVAGQRAEGGPVAAGASYLVGERGPELFTPSSSGMISPNGGGGMQLVINGGLHLNGVQDPEGLFNALKNVAASKNLTFGSAM